MDPINSPSAFGGLNVIWQLTIKSIVSGYCWFVRGEFYLPKYFRPNKYLMRQTVQVLSWFLIVRCAGSFARIGSIVFATFKQTGKDSTKLDRIVSGKRRNEKYGCKERRTKFNTELYFIFMDDFFFIPKIIPRLIRYG